MIKAFGKDKSFLRTLCLLIALVFAAAGPANAIKLQGSNAPDLIAFALPDGSLPIICFGNGEPVPELGDHCDECVQTLASYKAIASNVFVELLRHEAACQHTKHRQYCSGLSAESANPVRGPPLS